MGLVLDLTEQRPSNWGEKVLKELWKVVNLLITISKDSDRGDSTLKICECQSFKYCLAGSLSILFVTAQKSNFLPLSYFLSIL